jgi:hypothetical protein
VDPALFKQAKGCNDCHRQQHDQWLQSRHSHAWETLVAKGADRNPDCVRCHTTPPELALEVGQASAGVGCQTCHGDATLHSLDSKQATGLIRKPNEKLCRTCHDTDSDPNFSFARAIRKVRH